jgi:serine/threonine protein kinase
MAEQTTVFDHHEEDRLHEAIASFEQARDAGAVPDPRQWLARYPEVAGRLAEFFADQNQLRRRLGEGLPDTRPRQVPPLEMASPPETIPRGDGPAEKIVIEGYEILEVLGRGGMGVVHKARHLMLDRIVALKVIRPELVADQKSVDRFQREARAASRLTHPNLVTIYDAAESNGMHFLAMEYIEGIDLAHLVREKGPQPTALACDFVRQAALGLQHAYECGMVHRDIKPGNLLRSSKDGRIKLVDLGLALLQGSDENHASTGELTHTGAMMGTPDFIAPEQVRDCHNVDIRADLYSLGCTFYYLLAGRVPFPGGTMIDKLDKHRFETPQPIEWLRSDLPVSVADILRKLLAKRPEDRYQTPAQLADVLLPLCPSGSVSLESLAAAPPISLLPAKSKSSQAQAGGRRRRLAWAVAACFFVLLAVFVPMLILRALRPGSDGEDQGISSVNPSVDRKTPEGDDGGVKKDGKNVNEQANVKREPEKDDQKAPAPPPPKVGPVQLFWSTTQKPVDKIQILRLRPNVEQSFYLFAENGGDELKDVTFEIQVEGKPLPHATVTLPTLLKGSQFIRFTKPLPQGEKPPAPVEFSGRASVCAYREKDRRLCEVGLLSGLPSGYVELNPTKFNPSTKSITLLVRALNEFSGPRCPVELDLRPERLPFLSPKQKRDGTYGGYLYKPGDQVHLEARNLEINAGNLESGLASLTIDKYERAFIVRYSAEGGFPTILEGASIRLLADPAAATGPPLKAGLEADNLPDYATLEVGLYRDEKFTQLEGPQLQFHGNRRIRVLMNPHGPEGSVTFRSEITDWDFKLDTANLYGRRWLRVRLLTLGQNTPLEFLVRGSRGSVQKSRELVHAVLFDGSPPEDVVWLEHEIDSQTQTGERCVRVAASAKDPETGIGRVVFYLGKPPPDGVPPPTAVQVEGVKVKDKDVWEAKLSVPATSNETEVSVQFTNTVGLSSSSVTKINQKARETKDDKKKE